MIELVPFRRYERWRCTHCGFCCEEYDVSLGYEDEKRLRRFGNVFRYGKIGVYLRKKNGRCIFRKDKCRIYRFRPIACRKYPFYFREEGGEDSKFEFMGRTVHVFVDPRCSGLGDGERIEEVISRILKQVR
ncbi:putative Fe-S-cluster oxidoreductase [Geoglobus ahangari]|uniref:Putative Fe-S-cluster oxidoreductase n=1 Tax=Geoglobus ahangari TaxID=113653 RepID=A0A0F7IEK0_9EURY|nr:YkgJ family cysteine cluster protein [Geoglobus ahangari]AKG91983.1 putative Fe-S-cluster oxidoreductase [Geoglobus ahangari]